MATGGGSAIPTGPTGWMLVRLLSDQRTAIVRGDGPRPLREAPDAGLAGPLPRRARTWSGGFRAAPAAGAILHVRGRGGFIRVDQLWGVDPSETIR